MLCASALPAYLYSSSVTGRIYVQFAKFELVPSVPVLYSYHLKTKIIFQVDFVWMLISVVFIESPFFYEHVTRTLLCQPSPP
jgi:hypothetical protein